MSSVRRKTLEYVGAFAILIPFSVNCSAAKNLTPDEVSKAFASPSTDFESVNNFIRNTKVQGQAPRKTVTVNVGKISARLLTPLNSKLAGTGDDVTAVVIDSLDDGGHKWLPPGAILHGVVETSGKANYGRTDAYIAIRFYTAEVNGERLELSAASSSPEGKITPSHYHKYTKKEVLKGVLMTATKIAVPAAIGTGGISIAITTGAGAAIGFALAEKGEHIKGAFDGAWQGSGLCILNPIVKKGKSLQLAEGTALALQINEPIIVPKFTKSDYDTCVKVSGDLLSSGETAGQVTQLNTQVKLLNQNSASEGEVVNEKASPILEQVQRQIDQKNLAAALATLDKAERLYPEEPRVKALRAEVLRLITDSG